MPRFKPLIRPPLPPRHRFLVVPQSVHPLVRALVESMNREWCDWRTLERRSGVSAKTMRNWKRVNPNVVQLEACFNALGLTLKPVEIEPHQ